MWPTTESQHNARSLVAKGAILLDVRTPEEFREQHVPEAKNIPVQELSARLSEVGAKNLPVVVYCRSGGRSAVAASILEKAGYQVVDIGPMQNW